MTDGSNVASFKDRITGLQRIPASQLKANPKNWRKHPTNQKEALRGVLEEIGFANAVIARETPDGLEIIDGHLRQEIMDDQDIPVLVVDVSEAEADKMLATLDPIAGMAKSDKDALDALLSGITTNNDRLASLLSTMGMFETEYLPVTDLTPHPQNYVTHPDDQIEHLAQSIRENGLYRNVVIAQDETILAGHGVVEAAKKIGLDSIPVVRLDISSTDAQALKLLASDNEISNLAEVNDRALSNMLKEIHDNSPHGLAGTGYDEQMLANLLMVTRPQSEIADFDAAAEWVGMPEFIPPNQARNRCSLNLYFEGEDLREVFINVLRELDPNLNQVPNFNPDRTQRPVQISTYWPPRVGKEDIASVRFEG